MSGFAIDPRLATDTVSVTLLPLCEVRLMNDARFAWLILVPCRANMAEIADLDAADQQQLWREVNQCAAVLRRVAPCDKLNLGALGNFVRQLHLHVVARTEGDAAWPGPVWGSGKATPYVVDALATRLEALRHALASEAIASSGLQPHARSP